MNSANVNVIVQDKHGVRHWAHLCTRRPGIEPRARTNCGVKLGSTMWKTSKLAVTCLRCAVRPSRY